MSYHIKEDRLHQKWKKRYPNQVYNKDGLLYMGEQSTNYESRKPGNEELLWEKADIRILFILKESYGNEDPQDLREWMPHKSTGRIYMNMCRMVYGISNFNRKNYSYPSYNTLDMDKIRTAVAKIPYGYINIKKTPGLSRSDDQEIARFFMQDYDLIEEQIKILNPNVIFFCGILFKNRKIKMKVMEMFSCHNKKDDSWITTNQDKNIAIVDSYHLNPMGNITDERFYFELMESYKDYCKMSENSIFDISK